VNCSSGPVESIGEARGAPVRRDARSTRCLPSVNLVTAKSPGLKIPESISLRADEVIR
jgi:hypothetical protein